MLGLKLNHVSKKGPLAEHPYRNTMAIIIAPVGIHQKVVSKLLSDIADVSLLVN